jgi:hypothetical protein
MSVSRAPSYAEDAAASAYEEVARLNKFPCDGDHFGWFCETINAMFSKQSAVSTFGQIQLGACIFARFPEASAYMREFICSVLAKTCCKCPFPNLSIIVWSLRSLWKSGCSSDNLQRFSSYLAQYAAIHSDAAAPLMLSHFRHHIVDALYYNLIAMKCLKALVMRSVDRVPSSLQVGRLLPEHIKPALADVPELNSYSRSTEASIHSITQDTAVQRILSNVQLRVVLCMKLLGLTFESPMQETAFLKQMLHLKCVYVPFRLQDSTSTLQPSRAVVGIHTSVVFKSSIFLAVPQPILQARYQLSHRFRCILMFFPPSPQQPVPDSFTRELQRLQSLGSLERLQSIHQCCTSVEREAVHITTRSYVSSSSQGSESVVVELYRCGYIEKVCHCMFRICSTRELCLFLDPIILWFL